ncbi:TraR/DksA C4-type zinc finger protein [Alicyclobacillus sp. SO9]|uniref:TraR/DksA C4-type zinc finger protein n=1 Tax=Alicyclobacillus sp. SO9 TaxID=2665646 RepID=UPI0018E713BE|nr:TraR/DksA C4-type zinc finger protein [Alicyclobacillus sp. SO9]QQE80721.1 TraR/DksA C4-type zinc finger protein [Alicyclobacillus sp. SO9]
MELKLVQERLKKDYDHIRRKLLNSGEYGLTNVERDELGELSAYDNHPADIASEVWEREKDVGLRDRDKLQLQAIERALSAIYQGTYGVCQSCGTQIPQERLEALPIAVLCKVCQEQDEAQHPNRDWPVEEEFLYPGYARTNLDNTTNVEFDGEDSWQAVARYNERPDYPFDPDLGELDDNEGIVEETDAISNEMYKRKG